MLILLPDHFHSLYFNLCGCLASLFNLSDHQKIPKTEVPIRQWFPKSYLSRCIADSRLPESQIFSGAGPRAGRRRVPGPLGASVPSGWKMWLFVRASPGESPDPRTPGCAGTPVPPASRRPHRGWAPVLSAAQSHSRSRRPCPDGPASEERPPRPPPRPGQGLEGRD